MSFGARHGLFRTFGAEGPVFGKRIDERVTSQSESGWLSLQSLLALVPNDRIVRSIEPEAHRVGVRYLSRAAG